MASAHDARMKWGMVMWELSWKNVILEPMMHMKHVRKEAWLCRSQVYLTHGKCMVHARKGAGGMKFV